MKKGMNIVYSEEIWRDTPFKKIYIMSYHVQYWSHLRLTIWGSFGDSQVSPKSWSIGPPYATSEDIDLSFGKLKKSLKKRKKSCDFHVVSCRFVSFHVIIMCFRPVPSPVRQLGGSVSHGSLAKLGPSSNGSFASYFCFSMCMSYVYCTCLLAL